MSVVTIVIETDNDAFGQNPSVELARILRSYADLLDNDPNVRDTNGNTVGQVIVE